jgi:hypothetical protein
MSIISKHEGSLIFNNEADYNFSDICGNSYYTELRNNLILKNSNKKTSKNQKGKSNNMSSPLHSFESTESVENLKKSTSSTLTSGKSGKWTKEEDDILEELVPIYGAKNWKKIAEKIPGRTPIQCLHRWTKILQPGLVKGPWTIEEDRKLIDWVKNEGPRNWSKCAEFIIGRNGKQCRERWFNTLNPKVKKGGWEIEEDYKIFFFYQAFGGKWSKIMNLFEGRTENSIKNRFYSTLRRISAEKKKETSSLIHKSISKIFYLKYK